MHKENVYVSSDFALYLLYLSKYEHHSRKFIIICPYDLMNVLKINLLAKRLGCKDECDATDVCLFAYSLYSILKRQKYKDLKM